jgi:hypothetical protein
VWFLATVWNVTWIGKCWRPLHTDLSFFIHHRKFLPVSYGTGLGRLSPRGTCFMQKKYLNNLLYSCCHSKVLKFLQERNSSLQDAWLIHAILRERKTRCSSPFISFINQVYTAYIRHPKWQPQQSQKACLTVDSKWLWQWCITLKITGFRTLSFIRYSKNQKKQHFRNCMFPS